MKAASGADSSAEPAAKRDAIAVSARAALAISLAWLLHFSLRPFRFSLPRRLGSLVEPPSSLAPSWDTLAHLGLFLVMGVLIGLALDGRRRPARRWTAPLIVLLFPLALEVLQAFAPRRHATSADLLVHAVGTAGGLAIAASRYLRRLLAHLDAARIGGLWRLVFYGAMTAASASLLSGYGLLGRHNETPVNWSARFRLALANEPTGDRPWLGEFSRLSIFASLLSEREIRQLAATSSGDEALEMRRRLGALALYAFDEGAGATLHDRSQLGSPLDLVISSAAGARWTATGIEIEKPLVVLSERPAEKITAAIRHSQAFTVEIVAASAGPDQWGSARLATLSVNPSARNLTLAQMGDQLQLQLRNPRNGPNGSLYLGRWPAVFATTRRQHLVVTYGSGVADLYVDGRHRPPRQVIGAADKNVAGAAFFFFPAGIAIALGWPSRRRRDAALLLAAGLAAPLACYAFDALVLGRIFRWGFLAAALLGALSGFAVGTLAGSAPDPGRARG